MFHFIWASMVLVSFHSNNTKTGSKQKKLSLTSKTSPKSTDISSRSLLQEELGGQKLNHKREWVNSVNQVERSCFPACFRGCMCLCCRWLRAEFHSQIAKCEHCHLNTKKSQFSFLNVIMSLDSDWRKGSRCFLRTKRSIFRPGTRTDDSYLPLL